MQPTAMKKSTFLERCMKIRPQLSPSHHRDGKFRVIDTTFNASYSCQNSERSPRALTVGKRSQCVPSGKSRQHCSINTWDNFSFILINSPPITQPPPAAHEFWDRFHGQCYLCGSKTTQLHSSKFSHVTFFGRDF